MMILSSVGEPSLTVLGIIALVVGGLLKLVNKILDEKFTTSKHIEKELDRLKTVHSNQSGAIASIEQIAMDIKELKDIVKQQTVYIKEIQSRTLL